MIQPARFDEVLEQIEQLSDDAQAELVDLVRRRLAERGRQRIIEEVKQAEREHAEGKSSVSTVDELIREITS